MSCMKVNWRPSCFTRLHGLNRTGHPEYGCIVSKQKTLTNFEYDSIEATNVTEYNQKRMFNHASSLCCFLKMQ
ncbi:hypothetical protein BDR07DRAFT_1423979 [Suillus spraguei]|nr:hypothetical protein BDR07DRAFT_1423979 [Suillus spraguei]